jgi:Tfp pilus assembly protein PilP
MRRTGVLAIVLAVGALWASGAAAQQPSASVPAATAPASPSPQADVPSPVPYRYDADGRRDPFVSLTGTGGDSKPAAKPTVAGLAGIRVDELAVRGIMQSGDRFVAMVQGADKRTYLIHRGDRLADGVVKSIAPDGLVLVQDVTDPRAREKTREVRKWLRSAEDDKE